MGEKALQPAYVLHTRRYRESSLIVELLSARQGRCAVLAKGALGSRKAMGNLLQPFVPLLVDWKGRGELPVLTRCEAVASGSGLTGRGLYCGMYINELVLRLCERNDPHSALFPAYVTCVEALANADQVNAALEPILRQFELALLDELGLGVQLQYDLTGAPVDPTGHYHYVLESGPAPTGEARDAYSGRTLLGLAAGELDDPLLQREARALMRTILDNYLGGRPLRSRELFQ